MALLCSTYLWSVGVMEYWKNKTHIRSYGTLNSDIGISDAQSSRAIDYHSSTPILHHSLKLLQAEPIISDMALRAVGSASRRPKEPGFQR